MNDVSRLRDIRVAIVGLGLMGGSLALALKNRCARLLGCDADPDTVELASEKHIVDLALAEPSLALHDADLIILATPVNEILELIPRLPQHHPGEAVVMDIGSTKTDIIDALDSLPSRFHSIGGHPMCGKETSGLPHADATLFTGAPFALVPTASTSVSASRLAGQLVEAIGSRPIWLDAKTHDRWVAATSHLPYLLSAALSLTTPLETAPVVGPGFRSTSRLASSDVGMMLDILESNQSEVLLVLARFREQLDGLESSLSTGSKDALARKLARAVSNRFELINPH